MKKKINFAFATSQQTFTQPCPSPAYQCQAPWLNPFCIFSGWLHQECVAFWCSWPLSVDWCPWGIRQFKNSPLCTSQKPGVVCISSGTGAWCETSILILGDTSSATCCCAALNIPEGRWQGREQQPCCGQAGLLQQRGLEKGVPTWCWSGCAFSSQWRGSDQSPLHMESKGLSVITARDAWVQHLPAQLELWVSSIWSCS